MGWYSQPIVVGLVVGAGVCDLHLKGILNEGNIQGDLLIGVCDLHLKGILNPAQTAVEGPKRCL